MISKTQEREFLKANFDSFGGVILFLTEDGNFYSRFSDTAYFTAKIFAAVLAVMLVFSAYKRFSLYNGSSHAFSENEASETANLPFLGLGGIIVDKTESIDIRIPRCEGFNLSLAEKTCDFSFTNPASNECYLRVTITRHDTNETVYTSNLISPGKTVENISLSTNFSHFADYEVMIKVDAYSFDKLSFLNSLVMDAVIRTY